MRTTSQQDTRLTDQILDWVKGEVDPVELYGDGDLLDYVKENYSPQDVFSDSDLSDWAFENGYRRLE